MRKPIKEHIDDRLVELQMIESNLGTDSTDQERVLSDFEKDLIIRRIRDLDEQYYQDVFAIDK